MSAARSARAAAGLRPVLGFWEVVASGIGIIVGAGIYILIGNATKEAGGGVWLSFVLAAVLSGFTAISYCELAAMFPAPRRSTSTPDTHFPSGSHSSSAG